MFSLAASKALLRECDTRFLKKRMRFKTKTHVSGIFFVKCATANTQLQLLKGIILLLNNQVRHYKMLVCFIFLFGYEELYSNWDIFKPSQSLPYR